MAKNHSRSRTGRRAERRAEEKLSAAREKLFHAERGGTRERPIDVVTPALVETHARSTRCPCCLAFHEVVEHAAVRHGDARLREARLRCPQCSSRRSLWFRVVATELN